MATRTRKGTRHKGTQEALRQREKRFRALIEHSWKVILLSDVQGSYSYASPSIERVLGYTPEEFVHLNGFTLIHPDDLPAIAQAFQTLLATPGFSDTQQFRGKHKNGSWRWVEATATVLVRLTPDSGVAVVTVQDFGIGIAKEHQRSIFTRFYRVSDPEEQTYPGLGIGLYVSNEIIKRHGGTLTVSSEKGKGSQFRFTLPYARSTVKIL